MADEPKDPRSVEQALRKGEVEIRKLTAEADLADIKNMVPTVPAFPAGKLDPGDQPSPVSALGVYRALDSVSERLASICSGRSMSKVRVVPDDVTAREREAHQLVVAAIAGIGRELDDVERLLTPPEADRKASSTQQRGF